MWFHLGFPKKSKKHPEKIDVYVPVEFQAQVEKTREILHRENSSLSEHAVKEWVKYGALHAHGNPQKLLFNKQQSDPVKCAACDNPARFKVFLDNVNAPRYVCSLHFQLLRNTRRFRGYKKL